jgi:hypothetical protein
MDIIEKGHLLLTQPAQHKPSKLHPIARKSDFSNYTNGQYQNIITYGPTYSATKVTLRERGIERGTR